MPSRHESLPHAPMAAAYVLTDGAMPALRISSSSWCTRAVSPLAHAERVAL